MEIYRERKMISPDICEKISKIIPKNLEEVYLTSEKLEDNGITSKFLNRECVENKTYYRYLIEKKYVLHLYFEDGILKFLMIFRELPQKQTICEKELP
jgi:hypothetical protein